MNDDHNGSSGEGAASEQAQPDPSMLARLIAFELYQFRSIDADDCDGKVFVAPGDTLIFDPNDERLDLALPRLRRILENAASHAGMVTAFFEQIDLNKVGGRAERVKYKTALRLSVVMRDSLAQMARLLNGEDLDTPAFGVRGFDTEEVRLAEVYRMVKAMQARWTAPEELVYNDCQDILDFIARR